jgi:glycosyltransferase involved in cell wall biosynthesis
MKILVLASDNPSPPINGTRIRNFHLWREVRALGHEVKVLALTRRFEDLAGSSDAIEFFRFTRKSLPRRAWKRLTRSYHEWPVSDSLRARVQELCRTWGPDIVHAEELRMGAYLPQGARFLTSVCVHNVESDLIRKTKAAPLPVAVPLFNWIYRRNLIRFEHAVFSRAGLRLAYSRVDQKRYEALYPALPFAVTSNGVNPVGLRPSTPSPPATKVLFLGSLSYLPNVEGLFWFLDEVKPRLPKTVELVVAGSTPTEEVKARLHQEGVTLHDTPLDLGPIYEAASLLIVPLLSGSGTRGKILEALMYGRPVLTTSKGVEGLELGPEHGILRADGAGDFTAALENWTKLSVADREALGRAGHEAVSSRFTWRSVAVDLLETWERARGRG